MLEKHSNSKLNNILGITLCSFLLIFALTKAPQSIATEPVKDMEISLNLQDIPIVSVLQLINQANPKDISGYEYVPNINITLSANNVSANQIEKLLFICSGLKLIPEGEHFEIIKDDEFKDYSKLQECIQLDSKKEDVSPETVATIKKRNAQLREFMKGKGEEVLKYGELPFEDN